MVLHQSRVSLNNLSSRLTVLLTYIASILSLTMLLLILFVLKPSLNASFIVWQMQGAKNVFQNRMAASEITSLIQTGLGSKRSNCYDRFNRTVTGHLQPAKLKFTSS